jgi:hypothetical protein
MLVLKWLESGGAPTPLAAELVFELGALELAGGLG